MDSQDGKKNSRKVNKNASQDNLLTIDNLHPDFLNLPVFPIDDMIVYPNALAIIKVLSHTQADAALRAMKEDEHVIAIPLRRQKLGSPDMLNLESYYELGTYTRIIKIVRTEDQCGQGWQITVRGERRLRPVSVIYDKAAKIYRMNLSIIKETPLAIIGEAVFEDQNLLRTVRQSAKSYFEKCQPSNEARDAIRLTEQIRDAGILSDFLASHLDMPFEQHAALLESLEIRTRLKILLDILANQLEVAKLVANAAQKVRSDLDKQQRDYFIKQHIKALKDQI